MTCWWYKRCGSFVFLQGLFKNIVQLSMPSSDEVTLLELDVLVSLWFRWYHAVKIYEVWNSQPTILLTRIESRTIRIRVAVILFYPDFLFLLYKKKKLNYIFYTLFSQKRYLHSPLTCWNLISMHKDCNLHTRQRYTLYNIPIKNAAPVQNSINLAQQPHIWYTWKCCDCPT